MLRIHFTPDDLRRVRIAAGPDPLWEVLLSLHLLGRRGDTVLFRDWKRQAAPRLPASARLLSRLAPPWGYSPDFLTPAAGATTLDDGVEQLLRTPRRQLRRDLDLLSGHRRPGPYTRQLAAGDVGALRRLGASVTGYFGAALAPHWDRIRASVEADRANRGRALLDGGYDRMLTGLHPSIRWEPPVLSIQYGFGDRTLHLDGRGLLLLPSFFCVLDPITLRDPELPPVLVYPVEHELGWAGGAAPRAGQPLAALVGRTRAAVLETVETTCTTGELARRLGISPASASEHAGVLRDAGLITTSRYRNTSCHALTRLGTDLLNGRQAVIR
jgi:DNA-binding transcriptional ArsR family regulator